LFKKIFKLKTIGGKRQCRKRRTKLCTHWKNWFRRNKRKLKKPIKEILRLMKEEKEERNLDIELPTVD